MIQFRLDLLEVAVEVPFGDVAGSPLGNVPLVGSISAAIRFASRIWAMAAFHRMIALFIEASRYRVTDDPYSLRRGQHLVRRARVPLTGG